VGLPKAIVALAVVPVYGLVQDDRGRPCYAMRFIQGESLRDAIARFHNFDRQDLNRALALRELLQSFVTVCKTLAYAHSRGIIHFDLKPANIMLGKYGETLVVDWGLARRIGYDTAELTTTTTANTFQTQPLEESGTPRPEDVKGTVAFMSPEQAAGSWDEVGPSSDIFSLGATLYCILVGRPPYDGDNAIQNGRRGKFQTPRRVDENIPPGLDAICTLAMAFKPCERYTSALDLSKDIDRWLADEPVACYREPMLPRAGRWVRRHRTLAATAAVLLLTAVPVPPQEAPPLR
jgi:eukaryotic-like serine/threonine-protein kinase